MITDHVCHDFQKLDYIPISFVLHRLKSLKLFPLLLNEVGFLHNILQVPQPNAVWLSRCILWEVK